MQTPNKSLDASGGRVFRNLLGAAEGALTRAAASTQTLGGIAISLTNLRHAPRIEACVVNASGRKSGCVVASTGHPTIRCR